MAFLAFLYIVTFVASWSMAVGAAGQKDANEVAVSLGAVCMIVGIALSLVVLL